MIPPLPPLASSSFPTMSCVPVATVKKGWRKPAQRRLTSTRRPIMYMEAPKLPKRMTLYPGIMYFPRACTQLAIVASVSDPERPTYLLPGPQAVVLLEFALVVRNAVLAHNPAVDCQCRAHTLRYRSGVPCHCGERRGVFARLAGAMGGFVACSAWFVEW